MRTCTDTISSLAVAMQENPTPECIAECSEIITCCTEMLNIASEFRLPLGSSSGLDCPWRNSIL
jgi:hypothetical protein